MMTHLKNKKLVITSIIITLFMAVASPFQASAYDINTLVSPTGRAWEWGTALYGVSTEQGGVASATQYISGAAIYLDIPSGSSNVNNWILKSITKDTQIDFKNQHYYKTTISFNITSSDGWGVQLPQLNRLVMPANAPYKLVNVAPDTIQCYEAGGQNGLYAQGSGQQAWNETFISGCQRGYVSYNIIVQATENKTAPFQIGDGAQWMFEAFVPRNMTNGVAPHAIRFGTLTPLAITEYAPDDIGQINDQQQQAGEQAQQEAQQGGDQSQTDAEQGSASLLQGASTIISALTDTQASDCTINLNMGVLDMGAQNFCQGDIGPIRPIIATITNILFAFVSLKVFSFLIGVMFGLFDQFFGTKTEKG